MMLNNQKILTAPFLHQAKLIFFVGFLLFIAAPVSFYYDPGFGLDPGWMYAINMAVQKKMVFGEEFIFTYGPLGFLATRLPIIIPKSFYLIFDVYLLLNLGYVFFSVLKKNDNLPTLIFLFLIIILLGDFRDHDIVNMLSWIFLFMIFHYHSEQKKWILYNASLLSMIIVFTKLNLGIIVLLIFIIYLLFLVFSKTHSYRFLSYFAGGYLITLIIICFILRVNFFNYLIGSFQMISGYNDAMYVEYMKPLSSAQLISAIFLVTVFSICLLIHIKAVIFNLFHLMLAFVCILMIYVEFKQSFVRLHTETFFEWFTPIIALFYLFSEEVIKRDLKKVLLISIFCCFLVQGKASAIFSHELFQGRLSGIRTYYTQLFSDDFKLQVNPSQILPQSLAKQIKGSVDIVPYDVATVYDNNLDYNPRPVIQSYAAYTSYLDKCNADKYEGATAPENILIEHSAIDNRYPLFDETKTKLAILSHYEVSDFTWNYLLLKKLEQPLQVITEYLTEGSATLSQEVRVDKSKYLQCIYVNVNYSFLGSLRRLLFQPPQLFITLTTESGSQRTYKAIIPILKGGVIINKNISHDFSREELAIFLAFNGEINENIVSFKLHTTEDWGFQNDFSYHLEKITVSGPGKSKGLFTPSDVAVPPVSGKIQMNVEEVRNNNSVTIISGWGFPADGNLGSNQKFILLRSTNGTLVFPTQRIDRGDVSAYFKDSLDDAGFKAIVAKNFVPDGTYEIGLMIKKNQAIYVQYSDKTVLFKTVAIEPVTKQNWIEGGLQYAVERFEDTNDYIDLSGWAFFEHGPNNSSAISIIFESPFNTRLFDVQVVSRGDVSAYFKRKDLNNTGFSLRLDKRQLPSGTYKVAIKVKSKHDNFMFTDKMVQVVN